MNFSKITVYGLYHSKRNNQKEITGSPRTGARSGTEKRARCSRMQQFLQCILCILPIYNYRALFCMRFDCYLHTHGENMTQNHKIKPPRNFSSFNPIDYDSNPFSDYSCRPRNQKNSRFNRLGWH